MEDIQEAYIAGKLNNKDSIQCIIDQLVEDDQLEYDDRGLPDFEKANNEARKILNRWIAEIPMEELY
jgi:hypothetical protein